MTPCLNFTSVLPHILMNRCIRGPYLKCCERRSGGLNRSSAVYAVIFLYAPLFFSLYLFGVIVYIS
jgi:hypothetical protein